MTAQAIPADDVDAALAVAVGFEDKPSAFGFPRAAGYEQGRRSGRLKVGHVQDLTRTCQSRSEGT